MKLFQKLIAVPEIISMSTGFAVNATEINSTDLSNYSNSSKVASMRNFKSDKFFPGYWTYESLKELSTKRNDIDRLSNELGSELAIMKGRVDGLEVRVDTIEAGSFSETTTMKVKAEF